MKTFLITAALGAVLVAPAFAQQAPQTQSRQGWNSRVHVYAPDYYVQQHGNSNTNPDFQLTRER
jgi:opacity protein-like surface antigen